MPDGKAADDLGPAAREVAGAVGEPDGGISGALLRDLLQGELTGERTASRVDLAGVLAGSADQGPAATGRVTPAPASAFQGAAQRSPSSHRRNLQTGRGAG